MPPIRIRKIRRRRRREHDHGRKRLRLRAVEVTRPLFVVVDTDRQADGAVASTSRSRGSSGRYRRRSGRSRDGPCQLRGCARRESRREDSTSGRLDTSRRTWRCRHQSGLSVASSIDVITLPIRNSGPSVGWMIDPWRPSSPKPAFRPIGMCSRSLSPIGCSTLQA